MQSSGNILDISDNSSLENKLYFVKNEYEEELNSYLSKKPNSSAPFKMVKPYAGMCVKTFKISNNLKFFINICHTNEIPAPKDISEQELHNLIEQQQPSDFKVPLSITKPRVSSDKSNNQVEVSDVAINTEFYTKKIKSGGLFFSFLITLVFESLEQKYQIQINTENFIVLKNRPFIDKLVEHQIYNRDVKFVESFHDQQENDQNKQKDDIIIGTVRHQNSSDKILIEEISTKPVLSKVSKTSSLQEDNKNVISENRNASEMYVPNTIKASISKANTYEPDYRLIKDFDEFNKQIFVAEFYMPEIKSLDEIILDIGQDRVCLESRIHGYMFDKFLPANIIENKTHAEYDNDRQILVVTMYKDTLV